MSNLAAQLISLAQKGDLYEMTTATHSRGGASIAGVSVGGANSLVVKVTVGSAPEWLVTRYVVECSYNIPNGIQNCGQGIFSAEGGTVQGQISDESGALPKSIVVTITIDFQPETNLSALIKTFTPDVTDTGVNFIFEPLNQALQKTDVYLDLQPRPEKKDYLILEWQHHNANGKVVASGQKYLFGDELRQQPVSNYEIVFVPDPFLAKDLDIQIQGRFQDRVLLPFNQSYELTDKAVVIRAKKARVGGYVLVSA